ncbi:MAG TPA: sterol desaturase family protein [Terriglobia bacterium]|nr:sterol desaturase family protein [Terriglobia bacterium]
MACMIAVALGLFAWTLAEYLMHRFAFHRFAGFTRSTHPRHHATPRDLRYLFARPVPVLVVSAMALAALWVALGTMGGALKVMAGFWAGYLYYETSHYRIHFGSGNGWLIRKQRQAHFRHHFTAPGKNFGVTTPLWDWVFRTAGPAPGESR